MPDWKASRILHVLGTPRAEGTPNLVLDWLHTGIARQEVLVLNSQPPDLATDLQAHAHALSIWDHTPIRFRGNQAAYERIRHFCSEYPADTLICWFTGYAHVVIPAAADAGVSRLLVHAGNHPGKGARGWLMTWRVLGPALRRGAVIYCCSDYVAQAYRRILFPWQSRILGVPNCVRSARFAALSSTPAAHNVAIMVATLEPHKDHETLFQAVRTLSTQAPDFRLLLAGDGSLRRRLEARVKELGLDHHITFLGMRQDVPALLSQASFFIFSTTPEEGFGSVLIEALAAGLPVVASDVPACREVLQNGKWGRLVPPGDAASLSKAILEQYHRSSHLSPTADERRAYAQSFSAEAMMQAYLTA